VIYFRDFGQSDAESLLSGGHLLLSGIAGTGKTLLIRSKLLPWLQARGEHFVIFDYHGDYAQDLSSHCWLGHDIGRTDLFEEELTNCVEAAVKSSVVVSQVPHADTLDRFLTALFVEVEKGRRPKSPWYLVVDASHLTHSSSVLLGFIPMAERHVCTLVVTTQLLLGLKPFLFRHFKHLAQFCPGHGDDFVSFYKNTKGFEPGLEVTMRRTVGSLPAQHFICFSGSVMPQGYALFRTEGHGTDHDPVLP